MASDEKTPGRVPPYRLLDAFRGFAALWVVMLHACQPTITQVYPGLGKSPLFAFSLFGGLGVAIFFVISGYCIASAAVSARGKTNPAVTFVKARARRIYPPYYAASALMIVSALLAAYLESRGVLAGSALGKLDPLNKGPLYYVAALTLTQTPLRQGMLIVIFWSLCYEVAFYLVVLLAMAATPRSAHPTVLLHGLNGLTVACLAWRLLSPGTCPFPLDLWPMFGLGVLVFHARLDPTARSPRVWFAAAAALTAAEAARHWGAGDVGKPAPGLEWCVALGFAGLLLGLYRYDGRLSGLAPVRLLAAAGVFSYSLYLTHVPVLGVVNQLGRKLGVTESTFWVQDLVMVALSVGFARVFFAGFERPFLGGRPTPKVVDRPGVPPEGRAVAGEVPGAAA